MKERDLSLPVPSEGAECFWKQLEEGRSRNAGLKREKPALISFHLSQMVWNEHLSSQDPKGATVPWPKV